MSEKLDAPREKMIKSVVKSGPKMGFFANDGGDDTPLFPVDRLVGNLLDGGAASTGQNFGSLKEFVQNLASAQQKEAAGLAADMVELAYLKGVKDIRMDEAKAYGADDVRQVEARLDAQIAEVTDSIRTGVASMPKVDVAEITKLVDASLKDASDPQNKIRGATIKPMDSKGFKKAFNDIYEGLITPAGTRAQSELLPAPPKPNSRYRADGSSLNLNDPGVESGPRRQNPYDQPGVESGPRRTPGYDEKSTGPLRNRREQGDFRPSARDPYLRDGPSERGRPKKGEMRDGPPLFRRDTGYKPGNI